MDLLTTCYSCGGELTFRNDEPLAQCEFCGRVYTRPKANAEVLAKLRYANARLAIAEFAEAEETFREVLKTAPDEHEAHWGLLMCAYGVVYVENAKTGVRLPTCRKSLPTSFCDEADFADACRLAPEKVRKVYQRDGKYIDSIQREIRRLSAEEQPYDIFISYKEKDENGKRTADSLLAQNIYLTLKSRGFNAFYAPISLQNRLGANYEASIYCAVDTAKVMLVLGTKPEYMESTWVRSEWKRFLDRIDAGESKLLIPLYRGFAADRLPSEFSDRFIQSLDMSDVGFMFVLESNLEKIIKNDPVPEPTEKPPKKKGIAVKKAAVVKKESEAAEQESAPQQEPFKVDVAQMHDSAETEFEFASEGDDYRITKYIGDRTQVIIPAMIRERKVVAVGQKNANCSIFPMDKKGFFSVANTTVEFVKIPETVKVVEDAAFMHCTALRRVELHGGIEEIGDKVFLGCKSIDAIDFGQEECLQRIVKLPRQLKRIGLDVFDGTSIREVIMSRKTKEPLLGGNRRVSRSIPAVFYYED